MYTTVQDFIRENPYLAVDILTDKGVLQLPAGLAGTILTANAKTKLKVNGAGDTVLAAEVLEHVIFKIIWYRKPNNHVFLFTKSKAAAEKRPPKIEFEQLEFDLSDIPPQWL